MGWPYQQKPPLGWPLDDDSGLADFVGFWPMLEGSGGQVFDLSGNGINGTFVNTPTWGIGNYGSIVDLSGGGSDDYISMPSGFIQSEGTFIIRFKMDALTNGTVLCAQNDNSSLGLGFQYSTTKELRFIIDDTELYNAANVIATNTWYDYAGTWGSFGRRIYENGIQINSDAVIKSSTIEAGYTFNIGIFDYSGGQIFDLDGQVAFCHIYNRALTASEVALLYREPFCMFKDPAEIALLGGYEVAAGVAPTGNLWGPFGGCLKGVA